MISDTEKRRRARDLGVQEVAIERDFVLACLLAAAAQIPHELVFRGGTALARVYWPDHRLSEDLDFICAGTMAELGEWIDELAGRAGEIGRVELEPVYAPPKQAMSRSSVRWGSNQLNIDINLFEDTHLPVERRPLVLPYEAFRDQPLKIPTVDLREILGNKWFMLEDRSEPRDLYDVWCGVMQRKVPFDDLAQGYRAKYGHLPHRQFLSTAKKRLSDAWVQRLAHQIRDLPDLNQVVCEVLDVYDSWLAARVAAGELG